LRFVLVRVATGASAVLPLNVPPDARWLQIGERLRWGDGPDSQCFVIPLPGPGDAQSAYLVDSQHTLTSVIW